MRRIRWTGIAAAVALLAIAWPQFVAAEPKHLVAGAVMVCGAVALFFDALRRSGGGETGASQVRVDFDDSRITARYGNGERRSIAWDDLVQVGITTTDEGPMVDDLFWGLHSRERVEVVYPSEAVGAQALLAAMQARLKGFDNEALVRAMGSTANDRFVLWQSAADVQSRATQVTTAPPCVPP